jgi:HEAT repeat protein
MRIIDLLGKCVFPVGKTLNEGHFSDPRSTEAELYKELAKLTDNKAKWEENIPYVSSLLAHNSEIIQAKALWLLGEMGLAHPLSVKDAVPTIASFTESPVPLLRERAVNALGRIGRGSFDVIEPYWESLFRFADDEEAKVRLAFIWASENIATNIPGIYKGHMPTFEKLLHDENEKVRMEAPRDLPRPRQAEARARHSLRGVVEGDIG